MQLMNREAVFEYTGRSSSLGLTDRHVSRVGRDQERLKFQLGYVAREREVMVTDNVVGVSS